MSEVRKTEPLKTEPPKTESLIDSPHPGHKSLDVDKRENISI